MFEWTADSHSFIFFVVVVVKATGRGGSVGLFSYPSRVVRVFGFVQAAESALARGLFGNVVGPVKEFTD